MKQLKMLLALTFLMLTNVLCAQDYSVNTNCSTPFEDIATTGSPLVLTNDETRLLALPFNFQFYDRTYSEIRISNNGVYYLVTIRQFYLV
jgi:hypothetical protein